ncbi:MAG: hypothetical protein IJG13_10840 [Kiritimatiellae bacterium]|nr:hypothetical protein [Kiritimatiellia bacterium]MBQ3342233.1 hypothetical protein [Kiritimatiellia bacterium]
MTDLLRRGAGEENVLAAEVSTGWWRDKIVTPAHKSEKRYAPGTYTVVKPIPPPGR